MVWMKEKTGCCGEVADSSGTWGRKDDRTSKFISLESQRDSASKHL